MDTPVIRCKDSAKFVSGNLPISSAVIASTTPDDSRFIVALLAREPLIPDTLMTSILSSALVSWATALIDNAEPPATMMAVATALSLNFLFFIKRSLVLSHFQAIFANGERQLNQDWFFHNLFTIYPK